MVNDVPIPAPDPANALALLGIDRDCPDWGVVAVVLDALTRLARHVEPPPGAVAGAVGAHVATLVRTLAVQLDAARATAAELHLVAPGGSPP